MTNVNDTMNTVNEMTNKGFERMTSLGELNLRVFERKRKRHIFFDRRHFPRKKSIFAALFQFHCRPFRQALDIAVNIFQRHRQQLPSSSIRCRPNSIARSRLVARCISLFR